MTDTQTQQPQVEAAAPVTAVAPAAPTSTVPATSAGVVDKEMVIGKYRLKIIKHLCIGAASCVAVSPAVFDLDAENIAIFKEGATDEQENLLAAAQSCPTKAIEVYDNETGAMVWPV